jgi:polyhydroxyalkanoate synthase
MPTHLPQPPHHLGGMPLHITLLWLQWMSVQNVSQGWNGALSSLKPVLSMQPGNHLELLNLLESAQQNPPLLAALIKEGNDRVHDALSGIRKYQHYPVTAEPITTIQVVKTIDSVRLLYYPPKGRKSNIQVLLIPSLINRYYILDLSERLSLARFLQAQGIGVYIIDWTQPTAAQKDYDSDAYITNYIRPFLGFIRKQSKQKLVLTGYCMGGLFAAAQAATQADSVEGLALLAMPWDFHAADFTRADLSVSHIHQFDDWISKMDIFSAEYVQLLFYARNPWIFQEKFRQFSQMDIASQAAQDFISIEHWVNDGVALSPALARECLVDWVQHNVTMRDKWKIGGQKVVLENIRVPTFIAAPQDDRVVPASSALPTFKMIKNSVLVEPNSGHIGMIVGSRRKSGLWQPLHSWLQEL